MSNIKVFKRGQTLYKEGEKAQTLFLIQSGTVNLVVTRQKQVFELCALGSSQILGEHALSGVATHPHTAIATSETKVIELPAETVRLQIEAGSQLQKFLTKSLSDKLKLLMKDVRSMKLERDNTPCPPDQTAKIFGTIFHVAKTKGHQGADGLLSVDWMAMKQYAQRIFLESPKRFETAVNIFVKLGLAKYEMGRPEEDPEAPEEILTVHFLDLDVIEQFFEFYQYNYFKGGKEELLRTEERAMNMVQALVELSVGLVPVRNVVRVDYQAVIEKFKTSMGLQLNNDHWGLLEGKGLMVKRDSSGKQIELQFDVREFERTGKIWRVLREVERWNEKGTVDINDPVDPKKAVVAKAGGDAAVVLVNCPECGQGFEITPKFCSECGARFLQAA